MPIDDFKDIINESVDNLVKLPTGAEEFGDLGEFHKVVDFFANRYGMGGCKTIEEFADMIDNLDPVLRVGLYNAGVVAENRKWGGEDEIDSDIDSETDSDKDSHVDSDTTKPRTHSDNMPKLPHTSLEQPKSTGKIATGDGSIRNLLLEFGVNKSELDKASGKIGRRKITLKDYRDEIDKDKLRDMSEEKFQAILKDMGKERQKSINFDVSDDMYRQKIKKQRGGSQ